MWLLFRWQLVVAVHSTDSNQSVIVVQLCTRDKSAAIALVGWFVGSLVGLLAGWLVGWLVG